MYQGKLIASGMAFRHVPFREAVRLLKENGVDGLEATLNGFHFRHLEDMTEYEMRKAAETAERNGVRVYALNSSAGCYPPNPRGGMLNGIQALRLASFLGAETVTLSAGCIVPGTDTIEGLKTIAAYFNEMSLIAWNEYGIRLSAEAPHRGTCSEKLEQIKTYWAYMPERLGCTLDVAHVTYAGTTVEKVLDVIGPRLRHVHLRDAVPGNSLLPYGKGCVDFAEVFRLLGSRGYRGMCSLEYPGPEDPAEAVQVFMNGIKYLISKQKEANFQGETDHV